MNPVGVADPRIIPDNRITSSSSHHGLYQAAHGRLYSHTGGAWCSRKTDSDSEWLQVDIGEIIQACGVAIQREIEEYVAKGLKLSNCPIP